MLVADKQLRQARTEACKQCPHVERVGGTRILRCSACGCFVAPNALLLNAECPHGRWPASPSPTPGDAA